MVYTGTDQDTLTSIIGDVLMKFLRMYERIGLLEPYKGSEEDKGFIILLEHGVKIEFSDLKLPDLKLRAGRRQRELRPMINESTDEHTRPGHGNGWPEPLNG